MTVIAEVIDMAITGIEKGLPSPSLCRLCRMHYPVYRRPCGRFIYRSEGPMNPSKLSTLVRAAQRTNGTTSVSVESLGIESTETVIELGGEQVALEGIFDTIASWFRPETDFHKVTDLINSANFRKIESVVRRTILNGQWLSGVSLQEGPVRDVSSISSRLAYDGVWVQHSAIRNVQKYLSDYDRVCRQYWKSVESYYSTFGNISHEMSKHRSNMKEMIENGTMTHDVYQRVAADMIRTIADSMRRLQRIEHPSVTAKRVFREFVMLGPKATIEVDEGESIADVRYVMQEDASADAPVECMTQTQLMEAGALLVSQLREVRRWTFISFSKAVEEMAAIDDFNDLIKFVIPYATRGEIEMINEFKELAEAKQAVLWPKEIPNEYTIIKGLIYWIRETLPRNVG